MATSGPAHRVTSAVEMFGYPQGHLGHLTPEQETSFEQFKEYCREQGLYRPAVLPSAGAGTGAGLVAQNASHDDATLLSV